MADSVIKNDGGFILLNDGGRILLNEHEAGVGIVDTHASTIQVVKKRRTRTRLVNAEFSFFLIASLVHTIEIKLLQFKLQPKGLYSDALRESFKIPVTDLKEKLIKLTKLTMMQDIIKSYIDENLEDYIMNKKLYGGFKRVIKRWKKLRK